MVFNIIKIRKSDDRFLSRRDWLHSMHSFSFAEHRDPKWDNFGKIRVINEDIISPNAGFSTHSHANMEIITSGSPTGLPPLRASPSTTVTTPFTCTRRRMAGHSRAWSKGRGRASPLVSTTMPSS